MSYRLLASSLLAFAGLGLAAGPTVAADLDPAYGLIPPLQQERVEFGTGWYVRGDIGVTHGLHVSAGDEPYNSNLYTAVPATPAVAAAAAVPATTITVLDPATGTTTTQTFPAVPAVVGSAAVPAVQAPIGIFEGPGQTPPSLTSAFGGLNYTASLGAGYQFNRWFRADAVFDFHQPVQSSVQGQGRECITGTAGVGTAPYTYEVPYTTTCTPTLKATLKSYDALINGYVDLGTWHSITPYVGAGVGLSFGHAQTSSQYVQGNNAPYNITYTDAINGATYSQNWDRATSVQYYNLAFALMGGFAIDVFDHTKLDIGYRYVHLGSILGTNVATQEVRAGLRYMIDN